jgi:hypothetical protein|tara:strand:- start:8885 stop:9196 length:312 start_codon:yes stop_codon:yes gene_type:complete
MKSLSYSVIESFDTEQQLNSIRNNVNTIDNQNQTIANNENEIDENIRKIETTPIYNIKYDELKENEKFKQMENDYKSIILQEKFLLALGGIAFASLIVLGTQI